MRALAVFLLMISSSAYAADGFVTDDEYQPDFSNAVECRQIDGRRVWRGRVAYYIQSNLFMTGQSGLLDNEAAAAVPFAENADPDLAAFKEACD